MDSDSVLRTVSVASAVLAALVSPWRLETAAKVAVSAVVMQRRTHFHFLMLAASVLCTATASHCETAVAAVLVVVTPSLLQSDMQVQVNAAVLEVFSVYIGAQVRGSVHCAGTVLVFILAATLGMCVAVWQSAEARLKRQLLDSADQLAALQSALATQRARRQQASSPALTPSRLSVLSAKLRALVAPKQTSFSDYCQPYMSEQQSPERTDTDLSQDDVETLVATIITNEYVLFGNAKRSKADPTLDDSLFALLQKEKITLSNLNARFKQTKPSAKRGKTELQSTPAQQSIFNHLGEWNFSVFRLLEHTQAPLREVSLSVFSALSIPAHFSIAPAALREFLERVESGYKVENFYHNSLHAADVLNSVYYLLFSGVQASGDFAELEVFTLVTAAVAHDVGHPGVNNAFLVLSRNALAKAYNDQSVLENMHSSTLFTILRTKQSNITKGLTPEDYQIFRKLAISLILATDLQRHFDKQAEYRSALAQGRDLQDVEFRLMTLEICLKIADIGHGAKEWTLHKQWSTLITKEFFRQGDSEKRLGLPVSPLCNRETSNIPKSQIGFIQVFVKPLFDVWAELIRRNFTDDECLVLEECFIWIKENLEFWEKEADHDSFKVDDQPPLQILQTLYRNK